MLTYSTTERFQNQPAEDRIATVAIAVGLSAVLCGLCRVLIGPYGWFAGFAVVSLFAVVCVRLMRRPVTEADTADYPEWIPGEVVADHPAALPPAPFDTSATERIEFLVSESEFWQRKAEDYRQALDAVGEMYDGATAARKIAESAAYHFGSMSRAAVKSLATADQQAAKWKAKYRELRGRVYKSRERKLSKLSGSLRAAERRLSIARLVRLSGGIHREDSSLLASYSDWKEAVQNGVPRSVFRSAGIKNLDEMAESMVGDGIFTLPEDRHATDYLLELLSNGAIADNGDYGDSGVVYGIRGEIDSLTNEHNADDFDTSFNVGSFA